MGSELGVEIAPGVHRIRCLFGANRVVYVHLLVGDEAAMLVDTGCAHNPAQEILPYLQAIGFDLRRLTYIVISHSDTDHQGGNAPMKAAAPQALVVCHNLDRPWIEDTEALIQGRYSQFERDHGIGYGEAAKQGMRETCLSTPVDVTLNGGEHFRLSRDWYVEAVHTPGHTWGHLAVFDPRSRTLIAGEASMSNAILDADWQPAMPPTYCYVDTYLATQGQLLALGIEQLSTAHWPLQRGPDVAAYISVSRSYCLLVERKLVEYAHSSGGFTLQEAVATLGPTLGGWPAGANQDFSYGMLGNLDSLTRRGVLATTRSAEGLVEWRAVKRGAQ